MASNSHPNINLILPSKKVDLCREVLIEYNNYEGVDEGMVSQDCLLEIEKILWVNIKPPYRRIDDEK